MTTNRNPVKSMFLTFPKSTWTKAQLLSFLTGHFQVEYCKIVEESHQDLTKHLHANIKFSSGYSCAHILKKLKAKLPSDWMRVDVHPTRSFKHTQAYLDKEDESPLIFGQEPPSEDALVRFFRKADIEYKLQLARCIYSAKQGDPLHKYYYLIDNGFYKDYFENQ